MARKKEYDLGLQRVAFYGLPKIGSTFTGLLNQDRSGTYDVPADAGTVITSSIRDMNPTAIKTLAAVLVNDYYDKTGDTCFPDKLIMPMYDKLAISTMISPDFPVGKTIYQFLLDCFKEQTGNENFKILGTPYCQASRSGGILLKDRYVLTVDDETSLKMDLPVPYTTTLPGTANGFDWETIAYGQFTPVQLLRPVETLYYDLP